MGKMSREEALEQIKEPPPVSRETVDYCVKKLGLTKEEFDEIMKSPNKSYLDYHTSQDILQKFKFFVKAAVKMKLITPVLYEKYIA
jgi:hypothetical protein